nr:MAG TPA_asm: hypothetical protein [Caudoviricetes sp.]
MKAEVYTTRFLFKFKTLQVEKFFNFELKIFLETLSLRL